MSNDTVTRGALILGTYEEGFGRVDLLDYGREVSTRYPFITALEIFKAAPESAASVVIDYGPGTYFMVCMPTADTMVVLDDVTITD